MGTTCSTHGENRKENRVLMATPEEKRALRRPKHSLISRACGLDSFGSG
jgi:hypothetical protein